MTDNNHPITPPDELVRKWIEKWAGGQMKGPVTEDQLVVAAQSARWGFNQHAALNEAELQKARDEQLDACCDWLDGYSPEGWATEQMRNACRLKPKSQAEEALKAIGVPTKIGEARVIEHHAHELIRAALERLRELEGG